MDPNQNKANRTNRILTLMLVLVMIPLIYLVMKQFKEGGNGQKPAEVTAPAPTNISSLEEKASKEPTYENYISLGLAYVNEKQGDKSIWAFDQALLKKPGDAIAMNNLGLAYTIKSDWTKAVEYFQQAVAIAPDFQLAKNNLNWAQGELEKQGGATPEASITKDANYYFNLGMDLFKKGHYQESVDAYLECLKMEPGKTLAYNNLGTSYMYLKRYDEAARNFEKAIKLDPSTQLFKNNLEWAKMEMAKKK